MYSYKMLRYLLVILLFISTTSVFAQKTVSQEEYEATVDYFNCSIAKFYIEQNQGQYKLEEYLESLSEYGCNFEHLMVFIKDHQPQMEANGYLANYIESMKLEYDEQNANGALYNKLTDVFGQELLVELDGNTDYSQLKETLKEELKEKLRVGEEGDIGNVVENTTQTETSPFSSFLSNGGWILLVFLVILLIILIIFGRWAIKYFNTGSKKSETSQMEQRADEKRKEMEENPAPRSVPATVVPVPEPSKIAPEPMEEEEVIEEEPVVIVEDENVFYMPYPSIDGSFYEFVRHKDYEVKRSAFRFEIKNEEYGLATFEVVSDSNVITDIFMDYERTIRAVCEIEGKPKKIDMVIKPGIVRIVTVKHGSVQKSNKHWRLKQKAIIRFEYE